MATCRKAVILDELKYLHYWGPRKRNAGICGNLFGILTNAEGTYLLALMEQWPNAVDDLYPVAGPTEPLYQPRYNAWDVNTEAGARRHELLDWLIEELQK